MGEMKSAGIVAVSDDGRPVPTAGIMRRAMEYARGFDLTVVDHCQDASLSGGGVMHEGRWSLILGLRGMPAAAEDVHVIRDCVLAKLSGASVHIAHVSTAGALDAIRRAKELGLPVTCEVSPHHWTLTDEALAEYDTNMKMSPPLRSRDHVAAILEGLRDGTIDAIATDHAPHHADEKALEFDQAPFGITGLETCAMWTDAPLSFASTQSRMTCTSSAAAGMPRKPRISDQRPSCITPPALSEAS